VQVAFAALHWFGPLQRRAPSTSVSQCFAQQSLLEEHVSPVTLQALAGTSHLPFTQLSEQQSVLCVHNWWYEWQVAQLTPGKHVVPEQQPFAHDVASHLHVPLTHAWP
jgi:hypothetical protein